MKVGINEKIRKPENHKFISREHFDPPSYLKQKTEMGNFYIVEAGENGFAARKQKKNSSQGSKADKAFLPEGFSPRAKMLYLLLTRGMNFFSA